MSPVARPVLSRAAATAAIVPTAGLVLFAAAAPAVAAPVCADGWTEVAPGVCSLTVTQSGTVTVPAGVTHLEALLVGGGGASAMGAYGVGGAGGQVVYVDDVDVTGPVGIVIGAGGLPELDGTGGETSLLGAGSTPRTASGGGDEASDPLTAAVMPSVFVAAASGTTALWPAFVGETVVSGDGEFGNDDPPFPGNQTCEDIEVPAVPGAANTGRGGGGVHWMAYVCEPPEAAGGSGVVILRYAVVSTPTPTPSPSAPALAATGTSSGAPLAAVAGLLVAGAGALALSARARRQH